MKYIYMDNRERPPTEVFTCEAEDILDADQKYEAALRVSPVKQPYVGCFSPDWGTGSKSQND